MKRMGIFLIFLLLFSLFSSPLLSHVPSQIPEARALPAKFMGYVHSEWQHYTRSLIDEVAGYGANTARMQTFYLWWTDNIVGWVAGEHFQEKVTQIRQWYSDDGIVFWLDCTAPTWAPYTDSTHPNGDWSRMQAEAILNTVGEAGGWGAYTAYAGDTWRYNWGLMIDALHPEVVGLMNEPGDLSGYGVTYADYKQFLIDCMDYFLGIDPNLKFAACSLPFWNFDSVSADPIPGVDYYEFHYYYQFDYGYPPSWEQGAVKYWTATTPEELADAKATQFTVFDDALEPMYVADLTVVITEAGTNQLNPNYLQYYTDFWEYANDNNLGVLHMGLAPWDSVLGYYASGLLDKAPENLGDPYTAWDDGLNDMGDIWAANMPGTSFTQPFIITVGAASGGTSSPTSSTYYWTGDTVHTIIAIPYSGWSFSQWTGLYSGTDNPYNLTVTANGTITPVFTLAPPPVNVTITVTQGTGGITNASGSNIWDIGSSHVLVAIPYSGYVFSHWGGLGADSTANPYTLTVGTTGTITAFFRVPVIDITPPSGLPFYNNVSLKPGIRFKTPATGTFFYVDTPITVKKVVVNSTHLLFVPSFQTRYVTDLEMWSKTATSEFHITSWFTSNASSATFMADFYTDVPLTTMQFSLYSSMMESAYATGAASYSYNAANKTLTVYATPDSTFTITINAGQYPDYNHAPTTGDISVTGGLTPENWIFANDQYYNFKATFQDIDGYLDMENGSIAFYDGAHWINITYVQSSGYWYVVNGSSCVNVQGVSAYGSGVTLNVTYLIMPTSDILDIRFVTLYSYITDLVGATGSGNRTSVFSIYNLGGMTDEASDGYAGRVPGGDVFELYAGADSNSTVWQYWKNLKHVDFFFSYNLSNGYLLGGYQYASYNLTSSISFGIDYWYQGNWTHGLYVKITQYPGITPDQFSTYTASKISVSFLVEWYYKDVKIKQEWMRAFGFTNILTEADTPGSVPLHVELWFNRANASSLMGGRVSSEYYAVTNEANPAWYKVFTGGTWGIDAFNPPTSMSFVVLKDNVNATFGSPNLKLFKLVGTVSQPNNTVGQPDPIAFLVESRNFHSYSIDSNSLKMEGVDTPSWVEPKMPSMSQGGMFGWLSGALASIGTYFVKALIGSLLLFVSAFISALNYLFTLAGWTNGFSILLNWIGQLVGYMIAAMNYTITLLRSFFILMTTILPTALAEFGRLVLGAVSIFGILFTIWSGMGETMTGAGGVLVGLLQFLPLVVFIWIFMSKDVHECIDKVHTLWDFTLSGIHILTYIGGFVFDLIWKLIQLFKGWI